MIQTAILIAILPSPKFVLPAPPDIYSILMVQDVLDKSLAAFMIIKGTVFHAKLHSRWLEDHVLLQDAANTVILDATNASILSNLMATHA